MKDDERRMNGEAGKLKKRRGDSRGGAHDDLFFETRRARVFLSLCLSPLPTPLRTPRLVTIPMSLSLILSLLLVVVVPDAAHTADKKVKGLSAKEAGKLIAVARGLELKSGAVRVREISSTGESAAEALASVKTAFRFAKGEGGAWRVRDVRVGERKWEDVDLIARGWEAGARERLRADLEALASELEARRMLATEEEKKKAADSTQTAATAGAQGDATKSSREGAKRVRELAAKQAEEKDAELIRKGVFASNNFSALVSSATIEAEVEASFRFAKDARGKWSVSEFKVGESGWNNLASVVEQADAEKVSHARADLETVKAALESFRRERGFYVVSDDFVVLIDHLSPRHLTRIVRFDPWHRPYRYVGTRERHTLRSDGADGKENTGDDVTLAAP